MNLQQTIDNAYQLQQKGRFKEAEEILEMAVKLWADHWLPYFDLGCLKTLLRKYDEAEGCLLAAEQRNCNMPAALLHNRGWLYRKMGRIDEAIPLYRKAIEIDPEFAEAHNNLGICLMLKGHCLEGLEKLEYRFQSSKMAMKIRENFNKPDWHGEEAKDKTLLIYNEQGRGDAIQNLRYMPLVKSSFRSVIMECRPELQSLFKLCTLPEYRADQVVANHANEQDYDLIASINSLPYLFKGEIPDAYAIYPNPNSYDLATIRPTFRYWDRFKHKFRVGIVWAGSKKHPENDVRSVPASLFRKLAVPGVELFSLQVNPKDQLDLWDGGFYNDMEPLIDNFQDTVNIINQLDLVISVDTAVAHLAGAMKKGVWLILQEVPDYRWGMVGNQTPWYESMLLLRKKDTWESLFDSMAECLKKL